MSATSVLAAPALPGASTVAIAFEQYHAELNAFLRRAVGDPAAAEDLLQEAFLRLTLEVGSGRAPAHLRAWLYRVALNLVISSGRRRATAVRWLATQARDPDVTGASESPESGVLRRERMAAIEAVLATLPVDGRTALLLAGEGFSGPEIARTIGRTHGATRTLLLRSRMRVRATVQEAEAA